MKTKTKKMNVLVAGGAGYIGSVTTALLIQNGHSVTVVDNLSSGYRTAINPDVDFIEGNISDKKVIEKACEKDIDLAMHFAAFIEVGESVTDPAKYYRNNICESLAFFDLLRNFNVKKAVFSSTAAVYGEPEFVPLTENALLAPLNPYGWSKRMVEKILADFGSAYGFRSVCLRYFNAGGAFGQYGEGHKPESHLIPRILDSVLYNKQLFVFGDDYKTSDGSCVRDYIHVKDLAAAHLLAANYLMDGGESDVFNLGTGTGFTVFEVIKAVEKITGKKADFKITEKRSGDSAVLVASRSKAENILGWGQNLAGLEEIIESAMNWKVKFQSLYEKEKS